jgi:hypothetical protein
MSSADDATLNAFRFLTMSLPIVFVSSVSPDWLKMKYPAAPGGEARGRGGLGQEEVEMTEKPWRLADLKFEPMGDDLREKATINGVEIVRRDGRYSITAPEQDWSDLDEDEVDPALNFLFNLRAAGK